MFKNALKIGAAAVVALTGVAGVAAAQPAPGASNGGGGNGDVIITARKRAESLQKVPVAVTAISGQQLQQQGLQHTSDIQRVTPSLVITDGQQGALTAAQFELRGQTAGDQLLTLSQAVGLYFDSGNVPHPVGTNGSFFDIQRIEVLKGPQGTLYGRNTTGGAINVVTRGADYNGIHGFGEAEGGNHGDQKYTAAINVPVINDVLSFRLAGQYWKRDGFGRNQFTGQDLGNDHDDKHVRLSVRFDPTSNLSSVTKVEYAKYDLNGQLIKFRRDLGGLADVERGLELGGTPLDGAADLAQYANDDIFTSTAGGLNFDKTKVWHAVEDLTWQINDDLKLRSITSFHSVEDFYNVDLDGSPGVFNELNAGVGGAQPPAPLFPFPIQAAPDEKYHDYTQEFDLSGHSFGRLDWLVGGFASTEVGTYQESPVAFPNLGGLDALIVPGGFGGVTVISGREKADSWAVYTQNDLHLSDRVYLTLGARYTSDRNKLDAATYEFDPRTGTFGCLAQNATGFSLPFPAPGNDFTQCGAEALLPGFTDITFPHQKLNDSGISYLASFNFQMTPNALLYVKTSRGFRGGALQDRDPKLPGARPETATDYEIGLKADWFNHRLRTNFAAYHTNYTNKQVSVIILDPGPKTVVQNQSDATIDGFEFEGSANPIRGWSIYGQLSYLKGVTGSFPCALSVNPAAPNNNAACTPTLGAPPGIAHYTNQSGSEFADPNWRYSVGSRYEHEVGPGKLGGQLDWSWSSEAHVIGPIDPLLPAFYYSDLTQSIGLLNGRIDYTLPDWGLTVALFSTNLLDKKYSLAGLCTETLGFCQSTTAEPRMWGVQLRKTFGQE